MVTTITPTIRRIDNWEIKLFEFLVNARKEKILIDWENYNCASWVSDAIHLMTGFDPYAEFRTLSASPTGAYKMLKKAGFNSLEEVITSKFTPIPNAFVTSGDIVLVPVEEASYTEEGPSADDVGEAALNVAPVKIWDYVTCIAEPPHCWALSNEGLVSLPISASCKSFAVGR